MEKEALKILLSNKHLIPEAIKIQKSRGPLPPSAVISILYEEGKISEEIMRKYVSSVTQEIYKLYRNKY